MHRFAQKCTDLHGLSAFVSRKVHFICLLCICSAFYFHKMHGLFLSFSFLFHSCIYIKKNKVQINGDFEKKKGGGYIEGKAAER